MGVVPELTERPGAEYFTESWLGKVDSGVGVLLKTGLEGHFEFADRAVQFPDDAHQRRDGRSEGVLNRSRRAEMVAAEALLYSAGGRIEVASPSRRL